MPLTESTMATFVVDVHGPAVCATWPRLACISRRLPRRPQPEPAGNLGSQLAASFPRMSVRPKAPMLGSPLHRMHWREWCKLLGTCSVAMQRAEVLGSRHAVAHLS